MKQKLIFIFVLTIKMFIVYAELPKVESNTDSIRFAFSELLEYFCEPGEKIGSRHSYDWRIEGEELAALDYLLDSITYDNVKNYVNQIFNAMQDIELSGSLSKVRLADFKNTMEDIKVINMRQLSDCEIPDSVAIVYDDPNIATLLENEKIYQSNINNYEKQLAEMQTPEQIKKIIDDDTKRIDELKTNEIRNKAQIDRLTEHKISASVAYANAVSNRQKLQNAIESNKQNLLAIPAQIEQYKNPARDRYKADIAKKINNFQTWLDFFDGKNNILTDFLILTDAYTGMNKKIDELVPMRDVPKYQDKLEKFFKGWNL